MLAVFRRFLTTWYAKAFFVLLIFSFGLWGISGTIQDLNKDTALATVGKQRIEPAEFQETYRRQLASVSRSLGGRVEPPPPVRRAVAEQTLSQLIVEHSVTEEARRLGLVVTDEAVREAVFAEAAFHGPGGTFSRTVFEAVLRNNNLTEPQYLASIRTSLAHRQLLESVRAGMAPPGVLTEKVVAFLKESRVASYVEFAFDAAPEPPEPSEADLRGLYDGNIAAYSAPEFRRVKVVVLSPETLASGIEVPEADIAAAYEARKTEFTTPERRSVQLVAVGDEAKARSLASSWITGADWVAMQAEAAAAGASAVALDDLSVDQFPSAELAAAVFAAAPDTVAGPLQSPFGWQVFRVSKVQPGSARSLDEVRGELRDALARNLAVDQVYKRSNAFEDALSSSPTLDDLPGDLGVAALTGLVDARGNTQAGEPAPLPGSPAVRQAIVQAAFTANKGDAPRMIEGPEQSYFAVVVEDTTPAAPKPFADVQDELRTAWERNARRSVQDAAAKAFLAKVQGGTSLDDAATVAGMLVQRTPPLLRSEPQGGVPDALQRAVFGYKPGEAGVVEAQDAFLVAVLSEVYAPDVATDPLQTEQARRGLQQQLGVDAEATYAFALRGRMKPTVNTTMLNSFTQ